MHATPTGMREYPGLPIAEDALHRDLWVAEVVYFPLETELLRRARALGCRTLDGGGMAVLQAASAFRNLYREGCQSSKNAAPFWRNARGLEVGGRLRYPTIAGIGTRLADMGTSGKCDTAERTQPSSKRRGRSKSIADKVNGSRDAAAARANILAIATEEFSKKGLSGSRVDEIAERTHTVKRMIYYYFRQ